MTGPTISIVTACYNSVRFLDRLHRSLQEQTYRRFEWICVDDCSTDDTLERLLALPSPGELPMQVYVMPQNSYQCVAQAVGTQRTRGDLVIWLDHDDELFPEALAEVAVAWPLLRDDSNVGGLVFQALDPATGKPIGGSLPPGLRYSASEAFNRFPEFSDGTIAYRGDLLREIATVEAMEPLVLNFPVTIRATRNHDFLLVGAPPVRFYHRDNPDSQTLYERLSRKTVSSYAVILDLADRHYLRRPFNWLRHIATMLRMSKQVHGRWFACLDHIGRPSIRIIARAFWPLGWLALRRSRRTPTLVQLKTLPPEFEEGLIDLRSTRPA